MIKTKKRSSRAQIERFLLNALEYEGDDCLSWPFSKDRFGRGQVRQNGRLMYVSRVVCEAVNGPPPTPTHQAAHSCGRGHFGCVTKRHLSWKTRAENEADKHLHGTDNRGERHGMSKLTQDDVLQIRALCEGITQQKIADQFGISNQAVSRIKSGKAWAWL